MHAQVPDNSVFAEAGLSSFEAIVTTSLTIHTYIHTYIQIPGNSVFAEAGLSSFEAIVTTSPGLVGQYVMGMLKCVLHKACVRKGTNEDVRAASKRASRKMVEVKMYACVVSVCVCVCMEVK
jgi:hypothetical protein